MSGRREKGARLKNAALAALPDLVRQWLPGGEQRGDVYVALNPRRVDRHLGSFQIDIRSGRWQDHAIGRGGGDAISLYAYLQTGDDYRLALKALSDDPLVKAALVTGVTANPAKTANPLKSSIAKQALVNHLYAKGSPLQGMPAEAYLHRRGLRPSDAWNSLRASILPYRGRGRHPVLFAPVEAFDGAMVGLHRTYLTSKGAKLDVREPRLTLGRVKGAAIRLGQAADELIICEGLEDGLTLFQELGVPVWVACGAAFMRAMAIPDTVRSLTIAADNDSAGERAAQQAADAHNICGRDVRIMRPDLAFKDFNDQLQGIAR